MHWRFLDQVDRFEPWRAIAGRKAVSLEEYLLLRPLGRTGRFPESLVLECCVEIVRWLVAASSGFAQTSYLSEVQEFRIERETSMGDVLEVSASLARRDERRIEIKCRVDCSGNPVARGTIAVDLMPLGEAFDRAFVEGMWRELNGSA